MSREEVHAALLFIVYITRNNTSNMTLSKKYFSFLTFTLCLFAVIGTQLYIDFVQSPEKLEAVDCSGGVFTTGDDTITCTGDVVITSNSGLDFGLGSDTVTNDGDISITLSEYVSLTGTSHNSNETTVALIRVNSGNSNDTVTDTYINNGTTSAALSLTNTSHASVILFENNVSSTNILTNAGLVEASSDSTGITDVVLFARSANNTVTNSGIIRNNTTIAHSAAILNFAGIVSSSGQRATLNNYGIIGTSTNSSNAISSQQAITILNTGTIYGEIGFSGGTFADTITNRGTIVGTVSMDNGNDTYIHNIAAASVSSISGGSGTDMFCAEALDDEYEDFDVSDINDSSFEDLCITGGGHINYSAATLAFDTSVASSTTLSASSSLAITGDLTLEDEDTDGNLYVTIDSDTPTVQQFNISGDAILTGNLKVVDIGSGLSLGDTFTVLTANDISGTFATTDLPVTPAGLFWDITHNATSVVIEIVDSAGSLAYSDSGEYDISTATFEGVAHILGLHSTPTDMLFNEDGTVLYVIGYSTDFISQFNLTTPYDISTATFDAIALNVSGQEASPYTMLFNNDGTALYVMGTIGDDINEYTLSTPYDISTATFDAIALNVSGQEASPYTMLFNNDGTALYVMGTIGDDINEYTLSTPYDISTATFDAIALSVSGQEIVPTDMLFNNDGTALYVMGFSGDDINEYTLSTPYDISTATFDAIALNVSGQEASPYTMLFNNDGTALYVMGISGNDINEYTLSTPYDISTATFDAIALSVAGQETFPTAMLFNNDGTALYVMGFSGDDINEYTLSTPYDISTATFDAIALNVSGQEASPYTMLFNNDGTALYVMGTIGDDINEYTLSTPYDISTATFDAIALSVSGQEIVPTDMLFNNDGTALYVMGFSGDDINEYTLSTPYDISTATFDAIALNVSGQEASPYTMLFNNDGTALYVMGISGNDINEYTLSTPYDISTATFDAIALSVAGQETFPTDMLFNNDGTALYVMGFSGDDINEYSLGAKYTETSNGAVESNSPLTVTLSGNTFQDTDNDNLLDVGSEVTLGNIPAGLTPVLTLSNSDTVVTLTFTGNATYHADANDVSDITFSFSDNAFTFGDASLVTNSGDGTPYSTNIAIDFSGDTATGLTVVSNDDDDNTPISSSRRRSTTGSNNNVTTATNTNVSNSSGASSNVVQVLQLLRTLGLYDGPVPDNTATCQRFTENQSIGDEGAEVSRIQSFLTTTNHFNFTVTGYFGTITENAVKAFQAQYADDILVPLNLSEPTGNWFEFTRGRASALEC